MMLAWAGKIAFLGFYLLKVAFTKLGLRMDPEEQSGAKFRSPLSSNHLLGQRLSWYGYQDRKKEESEPKLALNMKACSWLPVLPSQIQARCSSAAGPPQGTAASINVRAGESSNLGQKGP